MPENSIESSLTIFFEDPFWVGVYERRAAGQLEVCKITFGPEPKDYQVYAFLQQHWYRLRFSPAVAVDDRPAAKRNPKRLQREIHQQLAGQGVATKAQQAMQLQQAAGKEARQKQSRLEREQERERQFALRQEKRKNKHRGH